MKIFGSIVIFCVVFSTNFEGIIESHIFILKKKSVGLDEITKNTL